MPRLVNELVVNIFYKNTNGVWVDYNKCIRSYPTLAIAVSAVRYQSVVAIDTDRLPRCTYMDSEYYMHNIDEHDGTDNDDHVGSIEIDTNDRTIVQIEPYSIDEPLLPFRVLSTTMRTVRVRRLLRETLRDLRETRRRFRRVLKP